MSANRYPNNNNDHRWPIDEPDLPARPRFGLSSTATGVTTSDNPSLLDTGEPTTDRVPATRSPSSSPIQSGIESIDGRAELDGASSASSETPIVTRRIRTGTWRLEEDGHLVMIEDPIVPLPDAGSEPINAATTTAAITATLTELIINSGSQEDNIQDQSDNDGGEGSRSPQLMWYEGEGYHEGVVDNPGQARSSIFLQPLVSARAPTTTPQVGVLAETSARLARLQTQREITNYWQSRSRAWNRAIAVEDPNEDITIQEFLSNSPQPPASNRPFRLSNQTRLEGSGSREILPNPTSFSRTPAPRRPDFVNAAGEIDTNLVPHAPRTDLPPPPPFPPLPRLTEEPPASWFEGMSEDLRCPVLWEPEYAVEYSFPCGHALCRWCYEQICHASSHPTCPLCRRRF
ncbi:hypothetical protein L873DRAFT_1790816 [Choiromyces venosus 120613-1]|uniref:RING-type domain-containing protein n=1 Tax=Choiromyces venosus 120613-1 TaxID=1336337 RepID=A0A3N4JVC1_9PEZI|nr:hypothetical protein L873DRAFT_1790816 [Choiromyces venosus 120613-1]